MLTKKQKRFLRAQSHHIQPIFQVGKAGVGEQMIRQINEALEARELIKITVLQNCMMDQEDVVEALLEGTASYIVQVIGHTIVLYKRAQKQPKIMLPES
ncbi:ribosome assembly RNA-binding protein YhbY [Shouchella lonarensis]|uniref:RNA-binding protein n=1 Tax=Shouchella lonarensis TaxID=1464122 RepID=A0A1G6KFU2_9BACI|nr:ribosome assembly RNA-binding protein YhbY [Shouchella lonarensis]SDC29787.1 RNA-binding protein [Shouchella lonarensis]